MAVKVSVRTKETAATKTNQCLRKTSKTSSTESYGAFVLKKKSQDKNQMRILVIKNAFSTLFWRKSLVA